MRKSILTFSVILFSAIILVLSVRGRAGNPTNRSLNTKFWKEAGPFELSPERGRFALTYSLVEDRSIFFHPDLARFVTPDVGYWENKYVSLFAPGVSFIIIPGYLIGKALGASQLGSFFVISAFALINVFLIIKISEFLGAKKIAAVFAGLIFLFATPSFSYATTLYQHHISTFLLLMAVFFVIRKKESWFNLFLVWFLVAVSLSVDYPNFFLMLPVGLVAFLRIFKIKTLSKKYKVLVKPILLTSFFGLTIPLVLFGLFNKNSYGSPFRLSGQVPSVATISKDNKPIFRFFTETGKTPENNVSPKEVSTFSFFNSRNILNGLYVHLLSPDRGVIFYTPIILFGIFGAFLLYKKENKFLPLLLSIVLVNLILYSMWGDPWGGWAFGSRYLIPSYAIMAVFISIAATNLSKNKIFLFSFGLILIYSIAVSTLGAITTNTNPPKVEAIFLQDVSGKKERYSFDRNWEYLGSFGSKSFVYQEFASKYIDAKTYYLILTVILSSFSLMFLAKLSSAKTK